MFIKKIQSKIQTWRQIRETIAHWKAAGQKIVFTNGCYDLLHFGHIRLLCQAKDLGDKLIVGLNSDASVARIKGLNRPVNDAATRQYLLAALECVDALVVFEKDTPLELIRLVLPDILVKGGDWKPNEIVGADVVLENGGIVKSLPFTEGYSTTAIVEKIRKG